MIVRSRPVALPHHLLRTVCVVMDPPGSRALRIAFELFPISKDGAEELSKGVDYRGPKKRREYMSACVEKKNRSDMDNFRASRFAYAYSTYHSRHEIVAHSVRFCNLLVLLLAFSHESIDLEMI